MDSSPSAPPSVEQAFELALLSDVGTTRPDNEDSCGHFVESPDSVVFAVADGVGGYEGGEIASRMAIDITLEAYRDSPPAWGAAKRLYRAITRANIEIHDKALTVPELGRMANTMTAVAVEKGMLAAVHVGDCRLHLIRHSHISVVTKDHTMVGERVRMGVMISGARKGSSRSRDAAAQPWTRADRVDRSDRDAAAGARSPDTVQRRPVQCPR